MILTDNSEDGINGDYPPSRWESQIDAVSILLASKYQAMTDSAAGLATMAGKAVEVLCTPTQDGSKVSSTLFGAKIGGHLHLINVKQIGNIGAQHQHPGFEEQAQQPNQAENSAVYWLQS